MLPLALGRSRLFGTRPSSQFVQILGNRAEDLRGSHDVCYAGPASKAISVYLKI